MTTNEQAPAMRPCRNCKGTGSVGWTRSVRPGETERGENPCPACDGRGELVVRDRGQTEGTQATIHCLDAVMGNWSRAVRKWWVDEPAPYSQYPLAVRLSWVEPRKRTSRSIVIYRDTRYVLVTTADGSTVYDSRADVPCDMDEFESARQRFADRPAFRTTRL